MTLRGSKLKHSFRLKVGRNRPFMEQSETKENHGREYAVAAVSIFGEYAAVKYGIGWLAWLAAFFLWLAIVSYTRSVRKRWLRYISWLVAASLIAIATYSQVDLKERESPEDPVPVTPTSPLPQDLSGIRQSLEEINKNLSRKGRPRVSAAQMEEIKELDQFIVGRDEMALRQAFGFPLMMEKNIHMNITIVSHFRKGTPREIAKNLIGHEFILDSELAEGHVRRFGGGFLQDQPDGTRVYMLMLPEEYSSGKKQLLKFETSSELPTPIIKAVKNFDDIVYKNADKLLHVLNDELKKDPDYYLRYDDPSSPTYFHQLDAMWLDNFIQLRPEADKIRDEIRKFLGVQ